AWDGTARLWDATTGRQTGRLDHETEIITSVAYTRDGQRLATKERSRGIVLWDVASQKAVASQNAARDGRVLLTGFDPRASLNPRGTLLAGGVRRGAGATLGRGHGAGSRPTRGARQGLP